MKKMLDMEDKMNEERVTSVILRALILAHGSAIPFSVDNFFLA